MSNYGRIVFFLFLLLGCSTQSDNSVDEQVLAQINGHAVSVTHFENAFKEYFYRTGQVLTPTQATRKAILDSEFNTYVLAVHAMDLGLDETPEAKYQRSAIEKRVLTDEYLNQVILADLTVNNEDLREYFIRFNSSLRASHLYASTKEKADEYYQRLLNGESFEELAKEAFINPYMAEHGGDIGRFTTDELDVAFENKAFSMKVGEISEPVQTAQGYSIIKLTDRVTRPVITEYEFNQNRERLEGYVRGKKEEVAQSEHLQYFVEESRFNEELVQEYYAFVSSSKEGLLNKSPEFLNRINGDEELLSFDNYSFDSDALSEEILASSIAMLNSIQDEYSFKNFLHGVAYRAYMVAEAKEKGVHTQPLVLDSIEETYLHYLEELAMNQLASQINNSEAELYALFQDRNEDFFEPELIRVQRLAVKGEEFAISLYSNLRNGADFTQLVLEHSVLNEDVFTEGDLGFIPISDFGFNNQELAETSIGEVTEPILYSGDEFHIYKVLDRREARDLTFAEARDQVAAYLSKQKLQQLRAETINKVMEKHNAVVDLEKLNALTLKI